MPKDGSDKVTITGTAQAVAQAKAEIKKIVDEQAARKVRLTAVKLGGWGASEVDLLMACRLPS